MRLELDITTISSLDVAWNLVQYQLVLAALLLRTAKGFVESRGQVTKEMNWAAKEMNWATKEMNSPTGD